MYPYWPTQNMPKQHVPQIRHISEDLPMMPEEASFYELGGHTEQIEEIKVDNMAHIQVGSYYELDRSKLPLSTPYLLLHCIRIVMVTVKYGQNVTVRYPNSKNLEAYIGEPKGYPVMDAIFIMESQLATEALLRQIPYFEVIENSSSDTFWFDKSSIPEMLQEEDEESTEEDEESKDIIKFEAEEMKKIAAKTPRSKKRKQKGKQKGSFKKENAAQKKDGDSIRWKRPRYERAKNELFGVMKVKEASYHNPIPRKELREAARKHIGDTGLLDHLLLHVVDNLAPGDTERFRRRCDPSGLTEYWLESADMMDIRKKAGVTDPYWIPPPDWKLGDPICNSSSCAAVFCALREEVAQMREEVAQMRGAQKKYEDLLKEKARREQELMERLNWRYI